MGNAEKKCASAKESRTVELDQKISKAVEIIVAVSEKLREDLKK